MKITIKKVSGTELYHKYPGQSDPQKCKVLLDCETGELSASYDPEIGSGVPVRQYNGLVQTWRIPALKEEPANDLLEHIAKDAWDRLPPATRPGNLDGLQRFPWSEVHQLKQCLSCRSTLNVVLEPGQAS